MILTTENIVKSFGKKKVLKGVSFAMDAGQFNAVVGENGSGKSTLLKIIVGQWRADSGTITIGGKMGYCPQKPLIFHQLSIDENFQYFSSAYKLSKEDADSQSALLLDHFNFRKYRKERVETLSEGTQQKLNLSLSLLHKPQLLILDEPYSGFDWETYLRFWDLTRTLLREGCAILIVSHFISEKDHFNRIYNLKDGVLE